MTRSLPISVRLALWYALTLTLLLGAFAGFCFLGYHAAVHRSFDRHLAHELGAVAPLVRVGPEGLDARALERSAAVATRLQGTNGTYVRLFAPDGAVVYESPNVVGQPALAVQVPSRPERLHLSRTWAGEPARSLVAPVLGARRLEGWVEVTGYEWNRHRELRELAGVLAGGVLLSALLALGVGWGLARRALHPVAVLTEAAGAMAAAPSPEGRLPADFATRDELTRLAETFNGLLARLDASVARERRFTANAAHELLTPLATLRSEAEVALRRDREPEAYRDVLRRVVEDAAWMAATVQGLLQLARAEALARTPNARVDLGALVRERVKRFAPQADAKGLAVSVEVSDGIGVAAEAAALAEVVDNLMGNAVKYTPPGGAVAVRLSHGDDACRGTARLEVADTGVGFDAAAGERLFDRFFRADTPAVQAEAGSGLGLAIVRAVAEGYGGSVGAASGGPGRGARFWVTLPCLGSTGEA